MPLLLLVPVEDDRLARPGGRRSLRGRWAAAAGSALLVHAVLLVSLVSKMAPLPAPREAASVSLVLVPRAGQAVMAPRVAAPAPVVEEATSAVVAGTVTEDAARLRVRPMRFAGARARSVPVPGVGPGAMPVETRAIAGAGGGVVSRAALDDGRNLAGLEAAIDQAVRDAATMPEAARRLRREGRVQVRFSYLDGAVRDIAVLRSGQSRLLDDAAMRAVQQAVYPAAPASIQGRRLNLVVWIDFRLSPA